MTQQGEYTVSTSLSGKLVVNGLEYRPAGRSGRWPGRALSPALLPLPGWQISKLFRH